jgi:hypothetical protein
MGLFNRNPADQVELENRVMAQDIDAAHAYLERFVAGEPIDFDHVTRALALIAVGQRA